MRIQQTILVAAVLCACVVNATTPSGTSDTGASASVDVDDDVDDVDDVDDEAPVVFPGGGGGGGFWSPGVLGVDPMSRFLRGIRRFLGGLPRVMRRNMRLSAPPVSSSPRRQRFGENACMEAQGNLTATFETCQATLLPLFGGGSASDNDDDASEGDEGDEVAFDPRAICTAECLTTARQYARRVRKTCTDEMIEENSLTATLDVMGNWDMFCTVHKTSTLSEEVQYCFSDWMKMFQTTPPLQSVCSPCIGTLVEWIDHNNEITGMPNADETAGMFSQAHDDVCRTFGKDDAICLPHVAQAAANIALDVADVPSLCHECVRHLYNREGEVGSVWQATFGKSTRLGRVLSAAAADRGEKNRALTHKVCKRVLHRRTADKKKQNAASADDEDEQDEPSTWPMLPFGIFGMPYSSQPFYAFSELAMRASAALFSPIG